MCVYVYVCLYICIYDCSIPLLIFCGVIFDSKNRGDVQETITIPRSFHKKIKLVNLTEIEYHTRTYLKFTINTE